MPRALPLKLPSELRVRRSAGCIGATAISPAGDEISAWERSQPANSVSAIGTGAAYRPAALMIAKPSARLAPPPPCFSGTQASVRPVCASPCHSRGFQLSSALLLMTCGSARSAKIFAAVAATISALSLTIVARTDPEGRGIASPSFRIRCCACQGDAVRRPYEDRSPLLHLPPSSRKPCTYGQAFRRRAISRIILRLIAQVTKSSVIAAVVPHGA